MEGMHAEPRRRSSLSQQQDSALRMMAMMRTRRCEAIGPHPKPHNNRRAMAMKNQTQKMRPSTKCNKPKCMDMKPQCYTREWDGGDKDIEQAPTSC